MSGQDFKVPPLSWDQIGATANNLRQRLQLQDEAYFPVMDVLERIMDHQVEGFHLLAGDRQEMGNAEGYTSPDGSFIMLREDVYDAAWAGDPRARFTAAHELGHWMMHTDIPLARALPEENVKPFMLSEPQANQFAAELLMPARFFVVGEGAQAVRNRHGVSHEAACNRLNYLKKKGLMT